MERPATRVGFTDRASRGISMLAEWRSPRRSSSSPTCRRTWCSTLVRPCSRTIARTAPTCKVVSAAQRDQGAGRRRARLGIQPGCRRGGAPTPPPRWPKDRQCGAMACASTIQARWLGQRGAACRASAPSAARTGPRSCGRSTALSSAPSRGRSVFCIVALHDGVHFVVGVGSTTRRRRRPAVPRRRHVVHTFKPHVTTCGGGGDARRPHIISGGDKLVKVWSVASKSP